MMGSGGFARTSLWLVFIDDQDRVQPVIVPIDDLPREPDLELIRSLRQVITELLADGGPASVAMLLSRSGPSEMLERDRRWARALRAELGDRLASWPIHLATRDRLQVFAPDDVVAVQPTGRRPG